MENWFLVQVETKNSSGSTPLHVASYYGSRDMINLLLEQGAEQTNKNKVIQNLISHHYILPIVWLAATTLRLSLDSASSHQDFSRTQTSSTGHQ